MERDTALENTSGHGKAAVIPPEIRGWNWGAFLLNWIWGIGNSTYIALLMFIPLVNIVMLFVLGAKGNEWAWRNRVWRSVADFKKTQRKWAWAGLILVVVIMPSCVMTPLMAMKSSEAYKLSYAEIKNDQDVIGVLGEPVSSGFFVMGSVSTNGPDGAASLQYSVKGSKAEGKAYVYAVKAAGKWELKEVVVEDETGKRITVVTAQDVHAKVWLNMDGSVAS